MTTASIDWTASRLRWHNHIGRWSNWGNAVLRRHGVGDRACVACVTQFTPREQQGASINPEARKARVSALAPDGLTVLDPPPDQELDVLIVFNPDGTEQPPYRTVAKPGREEPTPGFTLFWTLQVRR